MKIAGFETTGLTELANWLEKNNIEQIAESALREILKSTNISFRLEELDRVQSTFICELKDSYVQQSQRYVTMRKTSYILPALEEADEPQATMLVEKAFILYEKMAQLKNDNIKARPKAADFLHGIPIEDARYILPLATKTNVSVAMSGDKLLDFFRLINDHRYSNIFLALRRQLALLMPPQLIKLFFKENDIFIYRNIIEDYYAEDLKKLDNENNLILLSCFNDLEMKVGFGALTSTLKETPSEYITDLGVAGTEKAKAVAQRVLGYGHESVAEQARTTFGMMCSMATYHQQIRHRLSQNFRENLYNIITDIDRPVIIPCTIRKSAYYQEYLSLITEYKKFRIYIAEKYGPEIAYSFILNCDQIKLIISTNARIDIKMLADRTCFNSQWEIRELAVKKLNILRGLSKILYEKALPPCVLGACREGKLSCGQQLKAKEQFLIKDQKI